MDQQRLFGTDGVRGRAGEGWLATGPISALGRAAAREISKESSSSTRRALVGHDGRRSGPELEAAISRGLAAEGFEVDSTGLITTPGVALLARMGEYDLAVMISASHNPAHDNGIKIFGQGGSKLADELESRIETAWRAAPEPVDEGPAPKHSADLEEQYLNYLVESASDLKLDGLTIVLDCANGGGSRVAPRVLGRLGAHVLTISSEPDGDNINDGCGATQPSALRQEVRRVGADIGIALDGDGDRCILVDEAGGTVHGDGILTLVARHGVQTGTIHPPKVVATVMSNRGLHRALRDVGVEVVTVGVGDRRVVEKLRDEELMLGGEQSGHIVFGADNFHIGDGIYTALRVLRVMSGESRKLSELASPYDPFPQVLVNVPVSSKPSLAKIPAIASAVRSIEEHLGEDGRVLLRYSGTENLARVMVEGPDAEWIEAKANELAELIAREIGQLES